MGKIKTSDKFKEEVYELTKNEYLVCEEYKGAKVKIKFKHTLCDNEFYTTPDDFLHGTRCHICNGGVKKTSIQYKNEIYKIYGDEYTLLQDYVNSNTKILVRHNLCGNEWLVNPQNLLYRSGCPECGKIKSSMNRLKDEDTFLYEVKNKTNNEYTILGIYINSQTKIRIKHNICGYVYKVKPNDFLQGSRCPECQHRSYKKTTEEFKKEVYSLAEDEYSVLEEYVDAKTKIKLKHNIENCNNEFKVSPNNFLKGKRCPFCNESKGEKKISNCLKLNSIIFLPQYTFINCKRKECLPFDFAIFEDEEKTKLKCLIEYDGEFHFEPINGKRLLKYQQENDMIKTTYCQQNNIPLIRIPYWDFDRIEEILEEKLLKTK